MATVTDAEVGASPNLSQAVQGRKGGQGGMIQLKPFCLVVRKRDALCSCEGVTGPGESVMAAGTLLSRESPAEQRALWIIREPCTYHNENLSF